MIFKDHSLVLGCSMLLGWFFFSLRKKIIFQLRILYPAMLFQLWGQMIFFRYARIQKIYHPLTIIRSRVTEWKSQPKKRKIWDAGNSGACPGEGAVWDNSYASVQFEHEDGWLQELGRSGMGETSRVKNMPENLDMEERSCGWKARREEGSSAGKASIAHHRAMK